MSERFPDIEVYLAKVEFEALNAWLFDTIKAPALRPAGKNKWKSQGLKDGAEVPVLLVENAADGFASLWFDSAHTPWPTDQACATAAAPALGVEVRCSLGGWSPGDDPDAFWQVRPNGEAQRIAWPDSGR
ncbi:MULTISPECIES: hypothetical protein [unclassified Halomonas]|uniref:hypothetical protein n=1 Tax=unclassified Halomonas TaxID=2609666 RepID=UPI0020767234|nr:MULTISPECIES: hypothetical protein [unclassified Halomonas]